LTRDTSSLFTPPDTIGPYRILHQVGAGVLGPVFRALDPANERMVGIKLFRLEITPEQAAALADRLSALADMLPEHDGLVRPLAAGVEGSSAYLVSEYVAADSVDQRLRRKVPTPADQTLPLLAQIAAALDAAAAVGQYHGALHPRDVLVSTRGIASLTGVGVTQALEAVGFRPPFRRPYAAPERLAGRSWGPRADVFTLGVLALELATGRRPLMPESSATLQWVDAIDPVHAEAVRDVLAMAVDEDPSRRVRSAGAWVDQLGRALRGELESDDEADLSDDRAPGEPLGPRAGAAAWRIEAAEDLPLRHAAEDAGASSRESLERPLRDFHVVDPATHDEGSPAEVGDVPAVGPVLWESLEAFPSESESPVTDGVVLETPIAIVPEPGSFDMDAAPEPESPALGWQRFAGEPEPAGHVPLESATTQDIEGRRTLPPPPWPSPQAPAESSPAEFERPAASLTGAPSGAMLSDVPETPRRGRAIILSIVAACAVAVLAVGYWLGTPSPLPGSDQSGSSGEADGSVTATDAPVVLDDEPLALPADAATTPERTPGVGGDEASRAAPSRRAPSPPSEPSPARGTPRASGPAGTGIRPTATPAREGRMLVRSTPADAQVLVNGEPRGRTPLVLRDLDYGPYRVAVSLGGYASSEREVAITREAPAAALTFELDRGPGPGQPDGRPAGGTSTPSPAVATGPATRPGTAPDPSREASMEIVSRPAGARVVLDGRMVGTTPLRVSGLTPGPHDIRLEREGYRLWSGTITATAGRLTRVAASLEVSTEP
jgi:serine/threonine protein kinase